MAVKYTKDDYEIIPHSKLKHMKSFIINISYRNFHLHSDFELLLVLSGSGSVRIRDSVYQLNPLDSLIINQNETHDIESSSEPFTILIIQFSRHFCADYFPILRNTTFNSSLVRPALSPDDYALLVNRMLQFNYAYIKEEAVFGLTCTEHLTAILQLLYSNVSYTIINENQYREGKRKSERLNRISAYIGSNYLNPIRLKDLADMEGITTTHMSHIFTENFGITFQLYLTRKRMEEAIRLSQNNSFSTAMISELSGFSDPKYLNKAFEQKFGCNYREFISRKMLSEEKTVTPEKDSFEKYLSYSECMEIYEKLTL